MNADERRRLAAQHARARAAAAELARTHGDDVEAYRTIVNEAVQEAIGRLRQSVAAASGQSASVAAIAAHATDYIDWLKWTAWDIPHFAVAAHADKDTLRSNLAASVLVYFAGRVFDDFLDRHFLYRGRRVTLMAALGETRHQADADALTVVLGLLMCFEGLAGMGSPQASLVVQSVRRLLVGILLERSHRREWSPEYYERLIELKNVDYWRILYAGLDAGLASPLYPFLCRYYALAQKLNDLQDAGRDAAQGRPNLAAIAGDAAAIEAHIAGDLLELGEIAQALPEPQRAVALTKLAETHDEALRLGLFAAHVDVPPRAHPELSWDSDLSDVIERAGAGALEDTACPVCDARTSRTVFRKNGFAYERCAECTHLYVAPRARADVRRQLAASSPHAAPDAYLETQRIYAEYLCRLLRAQAAGPRLLDLGYGSGYLLKMARAYGFQVYGADAAQPAAELAAIFGRRLAVTHLPDDELPWGSFDVIVMNHVLEHVDDLRRIMPVIVDGLAANGFVYIAAPDSDSWQFRLFARNWDAVNPLAHVQFFNETSLRRLLEASGFAAIQRVPVPPIEGPRRERWMDLFRQLGGDEAGEVALIARRPPPPQASGDR